MAFVMAQRALVFSALQVTLSAASAREFNLQRAFDIIIHSSVQGTELGWGSSEGHLCSCCSHQSCPALPGALHEQGVQRG